MVPERDSLRYRPWPVTFLALAIAIIPLTGCSSTSDRPSNATPSETSTRPLGEGGTTDSDSSDASNDGAWDLALFVSGQPDLRVDDICDGMISSPKETAREVAAQANADVSTKDAQEVLEEFCDTLDAIS